MNLPIDKDVQTKADALLVMLCNLCYKGGEKRLDWKHAIQQICAPIQNQESILPFLKILWYEDKVQVDWDSKGVPVSVSLPSSVLRDHSLQKNEHVIVVARLRDALIESANLNLARIVSQAKVPQELCSAPALTLFFELYQQELRAIIALPPRADDCFGNYQIELVSNEG